MSYWSRKWHAKRPRGQRPSLPPDNRPGAGTQRYTNIDVSDTRLLVRRQQARERSDWLREVQRFSQTQAFTTPTPTYTMSLTRNQRQLLIERNIITGDESNDDVHRILERLPEVKEALLKDSVTQEEIAVLQQQIADLNTASENLRTAELDSSDGEQENNEATKTLRR